MPQRWTQRNASPEKKREIVRKWKLSSLSQQEYCKRVGISHNTFLKWLRAYRDDIDLGYARKRLILLLDRFDAIKTEVQKALDETQKLLDVLDLDIEPVRNYAKNLPPPIRKVYKRKPTGRPPKIKPLAPQISPIPQITDTVIEETEPKSNVPDFALPGLPVPPKR